MGRVGTVGAFLFAALVSVSAHADGDAGRHKVATIQHLANGDTLIELENNHNNPDSCDSSSKVLLEANHVNRPNTLAAAVMAKATQSLFGSWIVSPCVVVDGQSYARIVSGNW